MAKFGIALGSGPRGLGFESRHSDQKPVTASVVAGFLIEWWDLIGRHQSTDWCKKVSGGHFFSPWENPFLSERIPLGCRLKEICTIIKHSNKKRTALQSSFICQINCCSLIINLNCSPSFSAAFRHRIIRSIKISK